ncbi:MAG: sulfurtransferase [Cyanobacteria bacterium SZAS TMP-1]|nr:sulfurtransferase [Cyanobacteria bacterium SZAS TMP-1]
MQTINIASYRFVGIPSPQDWVAPLKEVCDRLALRGTIVLAEEGINLFLAGSKDCIDTFVTYLSTEPIFGGRFVDMDIKYSRSRNKPFKKMVVRVAREIITMRHPTIRPEATRAPVVEARKLKSWLDQGHDDEGRPVVLLDTRNAFEVAIGTFDGAVRFDIERFSEFPDAVKNVLSDEELALKEKTIVSFCTGGIRCEKAALFMQELDVPHIYQLDGGILRYFEEAGGEHWQGECFVFDERVAVDTRLHPTIKEYEGRTLGERLD